jgi:hypothetical protein
MTTPEKRLEMATEILKLIIQGDWKFDVADRTWDDLAVERAYNITDLLIKKGQEICH